MDFAELNGKRFAIVLNDETAAEGTFYGVARWDGKTLTVNRGSDNTAFEIREEWFERVQRVNSPIARAVLDDAEYWINMRVGSLPE